jgi:hypothetical protein
LQFNSRKSVSLALISSAAILGHDYEECPVTPISPSFVQFLSEWETICYAGPEIWLLAAFLEGAKEQNGRGKKPTSGARFFIALRTREIGEYSEPA